MNLQMERLPALLGPALKEIWGLQSSAQRQIHCVSVMQSPEDADAALYGELAVVPHTVAPGALHGIVEGLSARRAAGVLLSVQTLGPRLETNLRRRAGQGDFVVGVLGPEADTYEVVNCLNRALTRVNNDGAGVSIRAANNLQTLADTLGRLVDNSVTIESPRHELLAFSAMTGPVDRVREETILRRKGHAAALSWVIEEGHVDRVLTCDAPVHIPPNVELGFKGRLAHRIAYEGDVLGIIWVTNTKRPLTERDEVLVGEAARAASFILMAQREATQRENQLRAEILEDIAQGRITNQESIRAVAHGIGWNVDHLRLALIVSIDNIEAHRLRHTGQSGQRLHRARERLAQIARLEALAVDPEAVTGERSTGAIVLLGIDEQEESEEKATALRLATDIVCRFHDLNPDLTVTVGVGQSVPSFEQIAEAVTQAQLAADLGGRLWGGNRAVHYSDLGIHRALFTLQQHEEMVAPALHRIREYDETHHSDFLHTLDTYLACMGRLRVAAEMLSIHRNTLEYRVRRIEEVAGVRLDDRDTRLSLELGLRLLEFRRSTTPGR